MTITIRHADHPDVPEILRLGKRFHAETIYGTVAPLKDQHVFDKLAALIDGAGVVFLAHRDEELIGMLGVVLTSPWFNEDVQVALELFWWVEPEYRDSKQVGPALLRALDAWWPGKAVALMMLRTPNIKPKVMDRLYRIRGFQPWDAYYLKRAA